MTKTTRHFTRNFCCYSELVGEFRRLEHQFQFAEVDPPTENFIDLIRGKSNLLKENGPSFSHIFHSHYFLIRNIYKYRILFSCMKYHVNLYIIYLFCFVYLLKIFLVQSVGCFWPHSCCRVLCIISPSYLPPSIRKYLNKIETKTITQFVSPWEPGTMK